MMRLIFYVLALLAGAALSFEGAIYAELGKSIGQLETSFITFLSVQLSWVYCGSFLAKVTFPIR